MANIKGNDDDDVVRLLERAWESNEGAIQPGIALVRYYNSRQQPLRAVSIARDLNIKHPGRPIILSMLGLSQLTAKEYHSAQGTFEAWVKIQPKSPQAHFSLGRANKLLGETSSAKNNLKKSLSLSQNFLPAQLLLAQIWMQSKKPEPVLTIAKNIQTQRPKEAVGFRLEGDVLMAQKKYSEALKFYQSAYAKLAVAPLAIAIYQASKKAKINVPYTSLERWLKEHDDDQSVRMILASAYQDAELFSKAAEQYSQVVSARPEDISALNNLAWLLYLQGNEEAVPYARRAYNMAPEIAAVIDTYGWILVETGQLKQGIELLKEAVVKAPHLAEIRYHLGVGLYRLGRNAEAKSELKRVLAMSPNFSEHKAARALLEKVKNLGD
jgi:putative PEP-CTERM system TPR-repeat lipoprotein